MPKSNLESCLRICVLSMSNQPKNLLEKKLESFCFKVSLADVYLENCLKLI